MCVEMRWIEKAEENKLIRVFFYYKGYEKIARKLWILKLETMW